MVSTHLAMAAMVIISSSAIVGCGDGTVTKEPGRIDGSAELDAGRAADASRADAAADAAPDADGVPPVGTLRAFPTARGYGALSTGGRGGTLYRVVNLDDSGPGSFRDAISSSNRIVVFDVGGVIRLASDINVRADNLTIAGQTAPGGGVCFRDRQVKLAGDDIIVRHLRFRLGDENQPPTSERDSLNVGQSWDARTRTLFVPTDVIVDHCSASYGIDGVMDIGGPGTRNITVQNTILSEPLDDSLHPEGPHPTCGLVTTNGTEPQFPTIERITHYRNLFAHCPSRGPLYTRGPHHCDFANNVSYDYGGNGPQFSANVGWIGVPVQVNVLDSFFKAGPASGTIVFRFGDLDGASEIYFDGNQDHVGADLDDSMARHFAYVRSSPSAVASAASVPAWDLDLLPAADASVLVLNGAGAWSPGGTNAAGGNVMREGSRDALDDAVVRSVIDGTGGRIDTPAQSVLGGTGYPDYASGAPIDWTAVLGYGDLTDPAVANATQANGYTAVENYLNALAGDAI